MGSQATTAPLVFLAEDDEDMRHLLAATLRREGFQIREASNGADMLDLLANAALDQHPDVIVADVFMPGYSGMGLLAAVRGAGWRTPVILITAQHDESLRKDAANLGVTAFMQKPFEIGALCVAVAEAVNSYHVV